MCRIFSSLGRLDSSYSVLKIHNEMKVLSTSTSKSLKRYIGNKVGNLIRQAIIAIIYNSRLGVKISREMSASMPRYISWIISLEITRSLIARGNSRLFRLPAIAIRLVICENTRPTPLLASPSVAVCEWLYGGLAHIAAHWQWIPRAAKNKKKTSNRRVYAYTYIHIADTKYLTYHKNVDYILLLLLWINLNND